MDLSNLQITFLSVKSTRMHADDVSTMYLHFKRGVYNTILVDCSRNHIFIFFNIAERLYKKHDLNIVYNQISGRYYILVSYSFLHFIRVHGGGGVRVRT